MMKVLNIITLAVSLFPAYFSVADDSGRTPPSEDIIIFPTDWPSNLPIQPVEVYSFMEEIATAALGSGGDRRDEVIDVPDLRMLGKKKPKTVTFKMELTPDEYPSEIYWAIVDLCTDETIFEKFDYTVSFKKVKTEVKLPAGKSYFLFVFDSFGDGLCGTAFDDPLQSTICRGGFTASYNGKVVLTDGSKPFSEIGAIIGRAKDGSYVGCDF